MLWGTDTLDIDSDTQNELNKRPNVRGAMGGNITLTSNSSIGGGRYAFVLSGNLIENTNTILEFFESNKTTSNCYNFR